MKKNDLDIWQEMETFSRRFYFRLRQLLAF